MGSHRKRRRSRKTVVARSAVFVVIVAAIAAISSHSGRNLMCPPGADPSSYLSVRNVDQSLPQAVRARPIYPYSIIPGGVRSAGELERDIVDDPLVSAAYSDFNLNDAHIVTLDKPEMVYVSYRLDNRIYWTSRMLTLHPGETLITDGTHFARTRCGNRLSKKPHAQVSRYEPPPEAFNKVLPPANAAVANAAAKAAPASMVPRTVASLPVAPASFVPSPEAPVGPAPAVLIGFPAPPINQLVSVAACDEKNPPPGGCPKKPKCTEQHPCPPPGTATPEPGTIFLFVTGLLAAIGISRWKRHNLPV
jgi:hypothetical protein